MPRFISSIRDRRVGRAKVLKRPHRDGRQAMELLESRVLLSAAFPGAYGFGASATGGKGGTYYHVTNLNDSGAGSFRDAVSASNRIVVFNVGGTITLLSAVSVKSNITILGQSAPGQGIALIGRELSFANSTNDIVQYIRVRQGTNDPDRSKSGLNLLNATNMIFDHVSVEFAKWNNIDAVGCNNITVQNSIIADPIGQQFNAHTESTGGNFTWYNDIFANAHNRSPLAKINTQFINNIVYNFQAGYTGGDTSGRFSYDVINNYFIAGPSTTSASNDYYQLNSNGHAYARGNLLDGDKNGSLGGSSANVVGSSVVLSSPWSSTTASIPTTSAAAAYARDLVTAGDSLQRDSVDQQVIADVKSLGTSGHMWTSQAQTGLSNNGYGTINGGASGQPILNGTYTLSNLASQLALDDPANSKTAGTQMIQYTLSGATNQQWSFNYKGGGFYTISNVASGLVLDDPSGSGTAGVKLDQAASTGAAYQMWSVTMVNGGYVIKNRATGLVVDDPKSSTTNAGLIDLNTQTSAANQVWVLGAP